MLDGKAKGRGLSLFLSSTARFLFFCYCLVFITLVMMCESKKRENDIFLKTQGTRARARKYRRVILFGITRGGFWGGERSITFLMSDESENNTNKGEGKGKSRD